MLDPRSPDFEPVIETAVTDPKELDSKEWTPQRGLINGLIATAIAAIVLTIGWTALTRVSPLSMIFHVCDDAKPTLFLAFLGIVTGFVMTWILFVCMHKASRMVSRPCTVGVVVIALLMILARQIAIAAFDVKVDGLDVSGWEWLGLRRIIVTNLGLWLGIVGAAYLFHEGDSFVEMFYG